MISEVASKRVREQLTKFCCDWKLIENLSATTLTIIDSENIGDFEKKRNLLLELKNSKATFDELILAIFICGQLQPAIQACTVIFCKLIMVEYNGCLAYWFLSVFISRVSSD